MKTTINKLFEWIHVRSVIVSCSNIFDSSKVLTEKADMWQRKLEPLLTKLLNLKGVTSVATDKVVSERFQFLRGLQKV